MEALRRGGQGYHIRIINYTTHGECQGGWSSSRLLVQLQCSPIIMYEVKQMNINELFAMGFTAQELIDKGILSVNAEKVPAQQEDQTPEDPVINPPVEKPVETVEKVDASDINKTIETAFANLTTKLTEALQKANLRDTTGPGNNTNQMTLDEAINGLVKEM